MCKEKIWTGRRIISPNNDELVSVLSEQNEFLISLVHGISGNV
jgi:hypothetical protein